MSLALSYKDGGNLDGVTAREKKMAVTEIPSFLTYFSYILFVGQSMGPFCEFKMFDDYIHRRDHFANISSFETWVPAIKQQIAGWLCIVVNMAIPMFILAPSYLKTEEFVTDERGYLFRAGAVMITTYGMIFMYFTGFIWMEAQ